ncbi:MAG: hypothetical protein RIQ61_1047 [Bacteroidota bacterium]|jgi:hypothetical protein
MNNYNSIKNILFLGILITLFSCSNVRKENNDTNSIKKFSEDSANLNLGKKLFLDYKTNMTEIEFGRITNELISKGFIEKSYDGFESSLYYLFPFCEGSIGRKSEKFDRFKIIPTFENGSLVSIKICGLESGSYSLENIGTNKKWITCIYKELMAKYNIKYLYLDKESILYSKIATHNDNYNPIDELEIMSNSMTIKKPKKFKLPRYLIDNSKLLIPGETINLYKNNDKEPEIIKPIVIEKNDIIIVIKHEWQRDILVSYSLQNTITYKKLNWGIKVQYTNEFIGNSKQKIIETWLKLKINLEYMTYEYYKSKFLNKPQIIYKTEIKRNLSSEL